MSISPYGCLRSPPTAAACRSRLWSVARDARPDHRRDRAAGDRARPGRLVALHVGGHRIPRPGHGLAARLCPTLRPARAPRDAARRNGALPRRFGPVRFGAGNGAVHRVAGHPGAGRRRARGSALHPRRRPVRRTPQRLPAGVARRADGSRLHCWAAPRRSHHRWTGLAVGVPGQRPIGLAALVVVARFLPSSLGRYERRELPVDVAGITLLTAGVGLLLVGLNQRTATPLFAGAAVLATFLAL